MDKRTGKKPKTIKPPVFDKGGLNLALNSAQATISPQPVFSLTHMISGYSVNDCDKSQKAHFVSKLAMMAQQSWDDLQNSSHWSGAGFEMLDKKALKVPLPKIVTEDVQKLYVMRFKDDYRIIGHKSDNVYHITHIETDKSAYDHGN